LVPWKFFVLCDFLVLNRFLNVLFSTFGRPIFGQISLIDDTNIHFLGRRQVFRIRLIQYLANLHIAIDIIDSELLDAR